MRRRRSVIVQALAAVVVAERWPEHDDPERLARVTAAAMAQAERAPDVMRLPLAVLLHAFDAAPLVRGGRRFERLDRPAQATAMGRWRDARLGVLRSFVRYWESVIVLAWYADDEARSA